MKCRIRVIEHEADTAVVIVDHEGLDEELTHDIGIEQPYCHLDNGIHWQPETARIDEYATHPDITGLAADPAEPQMIQFDIQYQPFTN